ncbi:MAG: AI-2E family transporter [Lawsonibacter sp.]
MKRSQYKPYIAAGVTAFCVIAAAILLFFVFFHAARVRSFLDTLAYILRPIFLGMIIAFLLLPIHRTILRFMTAMTTTAKLEDSRNIRFLNALAVLFSLLFAFVLVYLFMAMVLPQVYLSIVGLVNAFPSYITSVQNWLLAFLENNPEIQTAVMPLYNSAASSLEHWLTSEILPNLESVTSTIRWLRESVLPNVTGVVSNVSALFVSFLVLVKDLLIALIVSVYLLIRKDIFAAQSKKIIYSIFPPRQGDLIVEEVRSAYQILSGFINGKLLDSLIIGIITLICSNLLKFPYPALIATIIGVTNIIPFFGPFIGAIPCAFLILLVSPLQCLYFILFVFVLQQFDGNILGPKILGNSTGLASFWVLFSILLFGGLFGFAGMVLGVPIFAMIYSVLRRLVHRGLIHHNLPIHTEDYMGPTGPMDQSVRNG